MREREVGETNERKVGKVNRNKKRAKRGIEGSDSRKNEGRET